MMSNIKDKKRKNNKDELSEHSQDAEIVIRQKSDAIFEKMIQSKTRNNNEKTFSHHSTKMILSITLRLLRRNGYEIKI